MAPPAPSRLTWQQRIERGWLRRGAIAWALAPLALLAGTIGSIRRLFYRLGVLRVVRLPVPVIVVGNLVAGGAGKTPAVIAITAMLRQHGYRPGIVSRGHGGSELGPVEVTPDTPAARCGDEPLLLRLRTGAPLVVGRDRPAAARALLTWHPEVDVIVSDDGLQHHALHRDAQVIVFDERGAGNGWLLPAGPLREPLPKTVPTGSLVLYNAACPTTALAGSLATRALAGLVALDGWWRGDAASMTTLEALRGHPVTAAAGIAVPERFFRMLRDQGLAITPLPLPDHHAYTTLPWSADAGDIIVTEKDASKLVPERAGTATRIWVAPLDFALDGAFEAGLLGLLPPRPRHGNTPA